MLSKKQRLKKEQIKEILKRGKSFLNKNISLKYLTDNGGQKAFAFIVSSKTAKKSVDRNLLKRRGRAIIFKVLPKIKKGCRAVIFFRKGSVGLKFRDLEAEIVQLLHKTNFLV